MNTNTITLAEKAQRTQSLMAMERLILAMGGRKAYIHWLVAMPEDAQLNTAGGLTQATAMNIAESDEQYQNLVRTFASCMLPVLSDIANE